MALFRRSTSFAAELAGHTLRSYEGYLDDSCLAASSSHDATPPPLQRSKTESDIQQPKTAWFGLSHSRFEGTIRPGVSISLELDQPRSSHEEPYSHDHFMERTKAPCHSVSITVSRRCPLKPTSMIASTKISIDVRFLKLVLLFSLLSTATGLALTSAGLPHTHKPRAGAARMDLEDSDYGGWGTSSAVAYSSSFGRSMVSHVASSSYGGATYSGWVSEMPTFVDTSSAPRSRTAVMDPPRPGQNLDFFASRAAPTDSATMRVPRDARSTVTAGERLYSAADLRKRLATPSDGPTVVVFGARTCRACRTLQPKMERIAAKADARFLFMYHDRSTDDVYTEYDVTQTPTTLVFDAAGNQVSRQVWAAKEMPKFANLLNGLQDDLIEWGI